MIDQERPILEALLGSSRHWLVQMRMLKMTSQGYSRSTATLGPVCIGTWHFEFPVTAGPLGPLEQDGDPLCY
jgi:hypothetical protein